MAKFELRQVEGFEDDDADHIWEDVIYDDKRGFDQTALLILQGHHLATLATLEQARAHDPDLALTAARAVVARLRCRRGLRRSLDRLGDPSDSSFADKLREAAVDLRDQASQLERSDLDGAVGAAAADLLCRSVEAWLTTIALTSDDVARLANHVAADSEIWVGLADGRAFLRRPVLNTGLDPGVIPRAAFTTTEVPPAIGECSAAPVATDPEVVLGPLHLWCCARRVLLCHCQPKAASFDEARGVLLLNIS